MNNKITLTLIFLLSFCANIALGIQNEDVNKMGYVNIPFWEHFNDEILIFNLEKVYENNHNLKAAAYSIKEAEKIAKISLSNELPHIGFEGYAGYISNSSNEIFGDVVIPNYQEAHFLLPLTYSYDVDIWGKNRLKTKSYNKSLEMTAQDEKALYIALTSTFANMYFNLIKADKLIECQRNIINVQQKITENTKKRYEIGTATINQLIADEKKLTFAKEELENLFEKQDTLQNQLNVLLADNSFNNVPRAKFDSINPDIKIPEYIGVNWLDERPDRVKSELLLEKNRIDIKAAKRDFLPSFKILGNIGFNFYNISSAHTFLSDIGIIPNWDLFSGGRKIAILKLQKARYDNAIENYENVILKSIQEANDSLFNLKSEHKKLDIVNKRLMFDEKEYDLVLFKKDAGMACDDDILQKQYSMLVSKKQQVSSRIDELLSLIELYRALGGVDFYECAKTL